MITADYDYFLKCGNALSNICKFNCIKFKQ